MEKKEIIDLHCHILPGLDDGIQEMEESIEACKIAVHDGITGIVATPHYKEGFFEATPEAIESSIALLKEHIVREGIDLEIYPGSEIHLMDDIPGKLRRGSLLSINGTGKYILLELPYQQYPVEFEKNLFAMKLAGITPVLAHPERIKYFKDDPGRIAEAVRLGALTQITSSSIMGVFGEEVMRLSFHLASQGFIHVIASDSHDASYRAPTIRDACREVSKIVGEREALMMISDNPRAIIKGKEIPEIGAGEQENRGKKKSGSFSFLRFFTKRS